MIFLSLGIFFLNLVLLLENYIADRYSFPIFLSSVYPSDTRLDSDNGFCALADDFVPGELPSAFVEIFW